MGRKIVDSNLLSYCWLYCEACSQYQDGKCPGCKNLEKSPRWCAIRNCCIKLGYTNCTECKKFIEKEGCEKFENMVIGCLKFLNKPERQEISQIIRKRGIKGYIKYRNEQNQPESTP